MTNLAGEIQYVNKAFEEIYGYQREEVLGKNPRILKSGYHDEEFYHEFFNHLKTEGSWEGVFKNRTRSGKLIWEHAKISPIRDDKGIISGYIAVKDNITYKKELEDQINQEQVLLNELFENSTIGVIIFQSDSNETVSDFVVLKANMMANTILNRMGVIGLRFSKLFAELDLSAELSPRLLSEKFDFEQYFPSLDKHLSFRIFPVGNRRICMLFYDVTNYKRTIIALQESESRYSSLVQDSPALICRFNREGLITYVNTHFFRYYNIDVAQIEGKPFFDFIADENRNEISQLMNGEQSNESIVEFEQKVPVSDTRKRWQKWVVRSLVDEHGRVIEFQAIGFDFTEAKKTEIRLRENTNKLNAIVNNGIIGVGVVDLNGNYKFVNRRLCEMFGLTEEELVGKSHQDNTHPDFKGLSGNMLRLLKTGTASQYNIEKKYFRKDGSEFWGHLFVALTYNKNGKPVEVVGLLADITEKKEIEMQLVESELKLKELNATKDKLFSIIAHDIKNPFHIILGFATLLDKNLEEYSFDEIHLFLSKIIESGENTFKLLEDLLTWGRSQLGKLIASPCKITVSKVVEECYGHYKMMAQNKQISLVNQIPADLIIYADYDMVKFVIRNLIHNGIKFTPPGGKVICSTEPSSAKGYQSVLVTDTGIGIHQDKLGILFDINAFLSTSGTENEKGTGLGLSLSREMIEKNNGTIEVTSKVGEGTTFRISLPLVANA
jgi:PAS domain S-box-containing protein